MLNLVGRLVVRDEKIVGLYIPIKPELLKPGIYDVLEFSDEIFLKYKGKQKMSDIRFNGLTPDDLMSEMYQLTEEEYNSLQQPEKEE